MHILYDTYDSTALESIAEDSGGPKQSHQSLNYAHMHTHPHTYSPTVSYCQHSLLSADWRCNTIMANKRECNYELLCNITKLSGEC